MSAGRLAEALAGDHFVKHGEDEAFEWGEHLSLSPEAAAHLADVVLDLLDGDEVAAIIAIDRRLNSSDARKALRRIRTHLTTPTKEEA